jgi:NADPH:quinone reductase-like Zn-dependent oxidoreductase
MMGIKLARAAGYKVILSSSSDDKLARIKASDGTGRIETVNYAKNPKWEEEVVKLNGGTGVDIVFENGGTSSLIQSIKATKKGGTVSQIGYLGKQNPADLDGLLSLLIDKTVSLR